MLHCVCPSPPRPRGGQVVHVLQREADHVEGFSPELAVVTQGGGKERVRRERRKVKAILRRLLAKPKRLLLGPPKDARGGTDAVAWKSGDVRC